MNVGTRLLLGVIATIGFLISTRNAAARDATPAENAGHYTGRRYEPAIFPMYLILFTFLVLLIYALLSAFFHYTPVKLSAFLTALVGVIVQISIYHMLLAVFAPVLRKRIDARGMSLLWLLPYILYLLFYYGSFFRYLTPAFVLHVNPKWCIPALAIWMTGTVCIFLWHVVTHLRFRHRILKEAQPLSPDAQDILRKEEALIAEKNPVIAIISDAVRTPLSIGLFRRSRRIVLPVRTYTPQELALIFRHELIHLRHRDCSAKLFLIICACICWWNPFAWIAMKKNAEDIELYCDEMVLQHEDMECRKLYSKLLLHTAGDGRGFTTCMSASARSLQYRLHNVLHPGGKGSGTAVTVALIFALFFTCSLTGFAYRSYNAMDVVRNAAGCDLSEFDTLVISYGKGALAKSVTADAASRQRLYDYLSSQTVYDLAQDLYPCIGTETNFRFESANGAFFAFSFWQNSLYYIDRDGRQQYYYVVDTVDPQTLAKISN